jgi:hypothetical protein
MIDTTTNHYYNITKHYTGRYIKFLIGKGNICLMGMYMYDTKDISHHITLWLFKNPKFKEAWQNSMTISSYTANTYDIQLNDVDSDEFILKLTSNSDYQLELFNKYKNETITRNVFITSIIIEYEDLKYIKYTIPTLLKLVVDSKLIPQRELLYLSDFYNGLDELI